MPCKCRQRKKIVQLSFNHKDITITGTMVTTETQSQKNNNESLNFC